MFCYCCKLFTCQAFWRACSVSEWWHWWSGWYEPNEVLSENCLNTEAEQFKHFQRCQSVGHSQLLSDLCFHTRTYKPTANQWTCGRCVPQCYWRQLFFLASALELYRLSHLILFQTQPAILKHALHWPQSPDQHGCHSVQTWTCYPSFVGAHRILGDKRTVCSLFSKQKHSANEF